jgi:outer membrane protein
MTPVNALLLCLCLGPCFAQPAPVITLQGAVEQSLKQYPSVRVSEAQIAAAAAQIRLARTNYLPRVDALAQANRATRNNIFGLLLPNSVISPISGPVLGTNNGTSVWGSAVGALVSWEPFDFGLRGANVALAEAGRNRAQAGLARTRFDLAALTADTYLTLLAAGQTVIAAHAAVERAEALRQIVNALVGAELRPGADASRAEAEVAAARTGLIQAEQAVAVAKANLGQLIAQDLSAADIEAGNLLQPAPLEANAAPTLAENPAAQEQNSAIDQARARLKVVERSYFPRFNLQATGYTRGTGALTDGRTLGGVNGLGPNVQNWAVGFTATFPILDLPAVHAREAIEAANLRAETSRYDQVLTELKGRWNAAQATLDGARRIAANAPVQTEAARMTVRQATARYQAGLTNIVEVAEAQRLLAQAEIDDAIARLNVWRAKLAVAAAEGNLEPFLEQARK